MCALPQLMQARVLPALRVHLLVICKGGVGAQCLGCVVHTHLDPCGVLCAHCSRLCVVVVLCRLAWQHVVVPAVLGSLKKWGVSRGPLGSF